MAEHNSTPNLIDDAIVSFYTENENAILRELIYDCLLPTTDMSEWKNILVECYESFLSERYLVIVPTLFTIIEGYLSLKVGTRYTSRIHMIAPTSAKAQEQEPHTLDNSIWLSISSIIDTLYQNRNFSEAPPGELNRHWILRGRNLSNNARVDSISYSIYLVRFQSPNKG